MRNRTLTLLLIFNLALLPKLFSQNVSINATGSLADTSAMLDVSSTTKGFLLPRMTTAQQNAIVLPATGLAIFNTTANSFMVNTGTPSSPVWTALITSATAGVTSINGFTGAITLDTSYISNFSIKVRSLFGATSPVTFANGLIGMPQASASANGYLSSADWNTFNNKGAGSVTSVAVTTANGVSGTVTNPTTTPAISLTLGAITPASVAATGNVSGANLYGLNTGDQTITLTGDVTGTGQGSFPTTIGNNKVTYAKMQQVSATSKLLGSSSSSLPVQEISLGTGLSMSGTTLSATGSGGTVTSVSVTPGNGVTGVVTNPSTTPAIALTLGAITPTSIAATGNISATGTVTGSNLSGTNTGNVTLGTANGLTLAGQALSLGLASASTTGALSLTDWNTFNNKGGGSVTNVTATAPLSITGTSTVTPNVVADTSKSIGKLATFSDIALKQNQLNGTGFVKANGTTITYDNSTYLTSIDTSNIANFYSKVRSLFSATAPVTYVNGLIGITQASATTNGYLSSTDWNTFNNKSDSSNAWSVKGNAGTNSGINYIGTQDNTSLRFKTNATQGVILDSLQNVAIGAAPTFSATNPEKLLVDAGTASYNVISGKGNLNSYLQLNIKNSNSGASASSDVVATNDAGTESNGINYVDMGVNSSGYASSGILGGANNAYLYATGNDFIIGNYSPGMPLRFFTTNSSSVSSEAMRIDSAGRIGIGTTAPTAALHVVKSSTGGLMVLQNTNVAGYSSADFLSNTGALAGTFGYGNPSAGASFAGKTYFNSYGNDFTIVNGSNNDIYIKASNNFIGLGTTSPANKLQVVATNPLSLLGVQLGTNTSTDSILTITGGVVKKLPASTFATAAGAISSLNGLTATTQTFATGNTGTDFNIASSGSTHTFNIPDASATNRGAITIGTQTIAGNKTLSGNTSVGGTLGITGNSTFTGTITASALNSGSSTDSIVTANASGVLRKRAVADLLTGTIDTTNINNFSVKVRSLFGATAPVTYSNGLIGITQSSSTTNGYLSSTDWNTFNNKASAFTTGNLTETGSGVLTITGGTGSVIGSGASVQVKQATTSQNGFLSSADWNTFNNKVASNRSIFTTAPLQGGGDLSANRTLSISDAAADGSTKGAATFVASDFNSSAGLISLDYANGQTASSLSNGFLSASDWTNFSSKLSSVDTTNIANFSTKVRSLFSASAPITYSNGLIGITQASATSNGYLSSSDWNKFNNKSDSSTSWAVKGNAGINPLTNFLGTTDNNSIRFRTNNLQRMKIDSTGNVAIGQDVFDATNPEKFIVNAGTTSSVNAMVATGSINNYLQINVKNSSNGSNATSDLVATADNGNESSNYIDLGINGSNYSGSAIQTGVANDGYLISAGNDFYLVNSSANKNLLFLTGGTGVSNERMRILANGYVGLGVQDPAAQFVVKDTIQIRRTGAVSQLLFTNTAGSGDFRIGGDGGDIFWQGGGGRDLQMGSYWSTILTGDRQTSTYPGFISNTTGTGVIVLGQRDASVPLGVQANSATQSANLTEWRNSSGSVLSAFDKNGNLGIGTSTPANKLQVIATNPLSLLGVQLGTNTSTDSVLTISGGVVKKLPASTFSTGAPSGTAGGDLTGTYPNPTIASNAVNNIKLAQMPNLTIKGNNTGSTANASDLTVAQVNAILPTFTSTLNGLVPLSGGGTTNFLRADGTWAAMPVPANTWSTLGNAGTTSSNFLGTTDAQPLVFRVNNQVSGRLDQVNTFLGYYAGNANGTSANQNTGVGYHALYSNSAGTNNTALGYNSLPNNIGSNDIGIGNSADVAGNYSNSIAMGTSAYVTNSNAISIGTSSQTTTAYGLAIGNNTYVSGSNAIAIGSGPGTPKTQAQGTSAIALGYNSYSGSTSSIAIGAGTNSNATNAVAIGNNATSNQANAIVLGDATNNSVNVGLGTSSPSAKLHIVATAGNNPLLLQGLPAGTSTDNLLTVNTSTGVVNSTPLSTLESSWSVNGNAGTTASNFLGTTDNTSLKFKTNSIQGIILDNNQNVGIGTSPVFSSTNPEKLLVDAGTSSYNVISGKGNLNSYLQLNIKNINSGTAASSDVVATNDAGTEANGLNYIDMGVNSSNYATGGVLGGASNAYLYATGNDFIIGNYSASMPLRFFTTNASSTQNEAMRLDGNGNLGLGTTTPAQKLDVTGNVKFSGALMPGGSSGGAGNVLVSAGAGNAPVWTNIVATSPITFSSATIAINQANTSTSGYLSSTDWNTFNNKASVANTWALGGNNVTSVQNIGTTSNYDMPFVTNNIERMRISNTGSIGVGSSSFNLSNPEKLLVDAGASGNTNYQNVVVGKGNTNSYAQLNIQNYNTGTGASSDVVATADNGNESVNFIDMGVNSSGNTSTGITGGANTAYLYTTGNDFAIGNATSGKNLLFFTGGTGSNERMRIDGSGNVGIGTTTPAAKLDVSGTYKLGTAGTALTNMIKTSVTVGDATTFSYTATKTYTVALTGATINASVIVNPRSALPTGISIAWANVTTAGVLTIGFTNTDTTARALGSTTFDITIIQ